MVCGAERTITRKARKTFFKSFECASDVAHEVKNGGLAPLFPLFPNRCSQCVAPPTQIHSLRCESSAEQPAQQGSTPVVKSLTCETL